MGTTAGQHTKRSLFCCFPMLAPQDEAVSPVLEGFTTQPLADVQNRGPASSSAVAPSPVAAPYFAAPLPEPQGFQPEPSPMGVALSPMSMELTGDTLRAGMVRLGWPFLYSVAVQQSCASLSARILNTPWGFIYLSALYLCRALAPSWQPA